MIEVEIKIQVLDPELLRQNFKKQGGVYQLSLLHEDTYYNMPKKLRNFAKTDEAFRIRSSIEFNKHNEKDSKRSQCYLTYKGNRIDNISKSRQEIEVKFDQAEKLREILSILGFREIFTIKKERELYKFEYKENTIEALIDYLPVLDAHYLEVELITESVEELSNNRALLFEFLSEFGYTEGDSIRDSYLELIIKSLGNKQR